MLLAVADGAGSARYAAEGAAHAVHTVIGWMAGELTAGAPETEEAWRGLLMDALARTRVALEDLAVTMEDAALRDFATTLLLAVVTPETLATLQVGDGAIVLRSGEELHVLAPAAVGEYVNETTFVTSADAVERVLDRGECERRRWTGGWRCLPMACSFWRLRRGRIRHMGRFLHRCLRLRGSRRRIRRS